MVEKMRYDTLTKNNNMIMVFTLVSGAFNTIIIPLIASGDFRWYFGLNILRINGQFSDLNTEWYYNAGPLMVFSMATLAVMPLIGIVIIYILEQYRRKCDSGWICCPKKFDDEDKILNYET